MNNTACAYTFLGNSVNIPRAGIINTTFYTYEGNQVHFIQYSVLFYKPKVAYKTMREIFELGTAEFTSNSSLVSYFLRALTLGTLQQLGGCSSG